MTKVFRSFTVLTIAIIISLIASLFMTVDVIADDTIPPPQPEEQTTNETEETSPPDETLGDILEQLPEETSIVLTTSQGIEPLATALAAELVLVGDPIWCPDGVAPVAGAGGCSTSYTSLSELVYNIPEPTANGVIWITAGTDLSPLFVSIDGNSFTNWNTYNLTIQGGWDGDAAGTISSTTSLSNPLEIVNWSGNVTINDIIANSVGSTGLNINTSGDIALNNITTNDNDFSGLLVTSGGSITAENITSNQNGTTGAEFSGDELILNGTNEFSENGQTGLDVAATGNVTLNNITANSNGESGAEISSTSGDVTFTGTNQFSGNYGTGLHIEADGTINIENITANNNGMSSAYGGGVDLSASSLNITGTNQFNGNTESGLYADITGNITLANIVAIGNGTGGNYGVGAELVSTGYVEITGTNIFSSNYSGGLSIEAPTGISIFNAEVENNLDTGLYLYSSGDVILDCSTVIGNDGYGVDANTPSLLLYGTQIDQNSNDDIVSAQSISSVSNSCFTYPVKFPPEQTTPVESPLVNSVAVDSGETTQLLCGTYSSTIIFLPNGDGALLPCGIGDNARLIQMTNDLIPGTLPHDDKFVSSFDLIVVKDGQPLPPIGEAGSLWYWEIKYDAASDRDILRAYFWDGTGWVNAELGNLPFIKIFFVVPEELKKSDLAILFWNGSSWVELTDELNLEQGRYVTQGGRFDGTYFEAEVNFIGTFVLVEK